MEGAELDQHYRETLRVLGTRGGMLGLIFEKAQNRIQDLRSALGQMEEILADLEERSGQVD